MGGLRSWKLQATRTLPLRGVIYATAAWLVMSGVSHGQADCGDWNRREFSENASISDVERCVMAGAEIWKNATNDGWAPIFWAARYGNTKILVALLDAGADFSARDKNGNSPLHVVAEYGDAEMVADLLRAGAEIENRNNLGVTPLFDASLGNMSTLTSLLDAGADIKARMNDGRSPLHFMVIRGTAEMIAVLLSAGAEIEARDKNGWTPIFWAASVRQYGSSWSPCSTQAQTSRLAIMTGKYLFTRRPHMAMPKWSLPC